MADDSTDFEKIALGTFIILTALAYIKPNLTITPLIFLLAGITAIAYLIKGTINFILKGDAEQILSGIALIILITLLIPNGQTLINNLLHTIGL